MAKGSGTTRNIDKTHKKSVIKEMSVDMQEKFANSMKMTAEERFAVYDAGTRFIDSMTGFAINRELNKGTDISKLTSAQQNAVKALDSVISKNVLKENVEAFRYNTSTFEKSVGTLKVGSEYTTRGFTALSANHDRNVSPLMTDGLVVNVKIPRGQNALVTNNIKESEIVLPRNTTFKVVKVYEYEGVKAVDVRIVKK